MPQAVVAEEKSPGTKIVPTMAGVAAEAAVVATAAGVMKPLVE